MKIKERIEKYSNSTSYTMIPKVPVVFTLHINNFSKLQINNPKVDFHQGMTLTMLKLCKEVEGSVFGYNFLDEIIIISRNDQTNETLPWYDNNIQKLSSITSAISSVELSNNLKQDIYFNSHIFPLPSMVECSNFVISKQHQHMQKLLNTLVQDNLNFSMEEAMSLSIDEKSKLLEEEDVYYHQLDSALRKGTAVYRSLEEGNNKWVLNKDLPVFLHNKDLLYRIFFNTNG